MNECLKRHLKTGLKVLTQENTDLRILVAILFLCKLEGQDVKLIMVSTMVGLSTPKLS